MFVQAKPLHFTPTGIRSVQPGDEVHISSGMGGSYTLVVVSTSENGVGLKGDNNTPSWLKKKEFTFSEAISSLYLLMPSADFGLTSRHIELAKKAGYESTDEIISIVSETADMPESVVKKYLGKIL